MNNYTFLQTVTDSFKKFLETGSRSNEKLKILHGSIAKDLHQRLGDKYEIHSLGYKQGQEASITGRYIDKMVDITVCRDGNPVAGIGVKFVMQNYAQNSNNYFENMLGETANIRSNNIPYFQIFIIPDKMPYYDNKGVLKKLETFSLHNAEKYLTLSRDNTELSVHAPTKTLLFVIHLPDLPREVRDRREYIEEYEEMGDTCVRESECEYGQFYSSVIYNDYDDFIQKVAFRILSE